MIASLLWLWISTLSYTSPPALNLIMSSLWLKINTYEVTMRSWWGFGQAKKLHPFWTHIMTYTGFLMRVRRPYVTGCDMIWWHICSCYNQTSACTIYIHAATILRYPLPLNVQKDVYLLRISSESLRPCLQGYALIWWHTCLWYYPSSYSFSALYAYKPIRLSCTQILLFLVKTSSESWRPCLNGWRYDLMAYMSMISSRLWLFFSTISRTHRMSCRQAWNSRSIMEWAPGRNKR